MTIKSMPGNKNWYDNYDKVFRNPKRFEKKKEGGAVPSALKEKKKKV